MQTCNSNALSNSLYSFYHWQMNDDNRIRSPDEWCRLVYVGLFRAVSIPQCPYDRVTFVFELLPLLNPANDRLLLGHTCMFAMLLTFHTCRYCRSVSYLCVCSPVQTSFCRAVVGPYTCRHTELFWQIQTLLYCFPEFDRTKIDLLSLHWKDKLLVVPVIQAKQILCCGPNCYN